MEPEPRPWLSGGPEDGPGPTHAPDLRGPGVSEAALPLPDVPLIVEEFLMHAKRLVAAGAPTEAIEDILDHVAALREGRG